MGHFVCELLIVTLIMNIRNINEIASQLRLSIFPKSYGIDPNRGLFHNM
jgi:hypothetical protein